MITKQAEYVAMAQCEKEMWWYKCLHELTLKNIEQFSLKEGKILDAGCGTGGMLNYLQANGCKNLKGFDLSVYAVEHARQNPSIQIDLLSLLDCDTFYPKESFDVIICNDILVLLNDNDARKSIENLLSLLKPQGLLLMNFAVGKHFRGTHDLVSEMVRRYDESSIVNLFKDSNAKISSLTYWPFLLSPLVYLVRLSQRINIKLNPGKKFKSDLQMPPAILNTIFYKLTKFENKKFKTKPWGSSIYAVILKN